MRRHDHSQGLNTHIITRADDPLFEPTFKVLDDYFGSRNEMESREVLHQRFNWASDKVSDDFSMCYQMAYITDAEAQLAAVGDYSVILWHSACRAGQAVVVHLSHIWVNPQKPGRGIVKHLMHSLTTAAAQQAISQAGLPADTPIILVGEMEPYEAGNEERIRRLKVFLYNGLRLVDPAVIDYCQPDFRCAEDIAKDGQSTPVPLSLMIRRVGREDDEQSDAAQIKHIVQCLYHMYAQGLSAQAMLDANHTLTHYPADDTPVSLLKRLPAES